MTSDIRIGRYKNIKPNSVKWKCSISNFVDTCTIRLPLASYVVSTLVGTDDVATKGKRTVFNEGDKVVVSLGYDGTNTKRFVGFVNRINYAAPLELECEGYSYQLKKKLITKSYQSTTIKKILTDLIDGTDIQLSPYIPNVPITNVTFKNSPAFKVLEWFQKECLCTVYFDYDMLYVGASKFAVPKPHHKIRLGWNTAEDKELKKAIENTETIVHVVEKSPAGAVKRTKSDQSKFDNIKDVKIRAGLPADFVKKLANEIQIAQNTGGYRGDITCFLVPSIENGDVLEITDKRFPDREGSYFVEAVDGSFDNSGGRQKITLRYYGKLD